MRRSDALKMIANQLDFLNGKFNGIRDNFNKDELSCADVILTTLEESGMRPPLKKVCPVLLTSEYYWKPEDEQN